MYTNTCTYRCTQTHVYTGVTNTPVYTGVTNKTLGELTSVHDTTAVDSVQMSHVLDTSQAQACTDDIKRDHHGDDTNVNQS